MSVLPTSRAIASVPQSINLTFWQPEILQPDYEGDQMLFIRLHGGRGPLTRWAGNYQGR